MRKLITIIFILLCANLMYSGELKIEVTKIKYISGKLFIGLGNKPSIFPRIRSSYKWQEVKVNDNKSTCIFKNIPSGKYAISIFHDVNNNRRFDKHPIGIPKEPYGFSNNVIGILGPPSFAAASVKVEKKGVRSITIELKEAL